MNIAYRQPDTDRRPGLLLTALLHVALGIGWQAVRTLPAPMSAQDGARSRILWIPLPAPRPVLRDRAPAPPRKQAAAQPAQRHPAGIHVLPPTPQAEPRRAPTPAPADSAASVPAAAAAASSQSAPAKPNAGQILERARRDIGGIDKALRKENRPYIAAPLDSPQMRLRRGIEHAAEMAPNAWYQAPKTEELVNNTGDGARRGRVITGNGSYCVTERSPATSIDMIEKHGKLRITNCPEHEEPARQQAWRTLQD
ncbi:hypothetical protein ACI48D_02080 [Massilia sp. LXY-6]|uniref:hypothetical protein n=1 Tax=Massilia sp. LXY-6 TaxID=3379823 RepID=UPI003EE2645B